MISSQIRALMEHNLNQFEVLISNVKKLELINENQLVGYINKSKRDYKRNLHTYLSINGGKALFRLKLTVKPTLLVHLIQCEIKGNQTLNQHGFYIPSYLGRSELAEFINPIISKYEIGLCTLEEAKKDIGLVVINQHQDIFRISEKGNVEFLIF